MHCICTHPARCDEGFLALRYGPFHTSALALHTSIFVLFAFTVPWLEPNSGSSHRAPKRQERSMTSSSNTFRSHRILNADVPNEQQVSQALGKEESPARNPGLTRSSPQNRLLYLASHDFLNPSIALDRKFSSGRESWASRSWGCLHHYAPCPTSDTTTSTIFPKRDTRSREVSLFARTRFYFPCAKYIGNSLGLL